MKCYAVFDIGGSSIKHAVMNEQGEIVYDSPSVPTPCEDFNLLVDAIVKIVNEYGGVQALEGIAMSMPCPVNPKTSDTTGTGAVSCLRDGNIRKILEERTGLKVILENDANCAGLAEGFIGNAKDVDNYVVLVLGSGIGGTIVINNQIVYGKNLHAGEFGCMMMSNLFDKPSDNIFSRLASPVNVSRKVADAKNIPYEEIDFIKVFELANQKDEIAMAELEKFYRYLAVGIFNIQYSIDPDKILIGGSISVRKDLFEKLNAILATMKATHNTLDIFVEPCLLTGDANLVGALYNFMQKIK